MIRGGYEPAGEIDGWNCQGTGLSLQMSFDKSQRVDKYNFLYHLSSDMMVLLLILDNGININMLM